MSQLHYQVRLLQQIGWKRFFLEISSFGIIINLCMPDKRFKLKRLFYNYFVKLNILKRIFPVLWYNFQINLTVIEHFPINVKWDHDFVTWYSGLCSHGNICGFKNPMLRLLFVNLFSSHILYLITYHYFASLINIYSAD